jgi:hypothetical protein
MAQNQGRSQKERGTRVLAGQQQGGKVNIPNKKKLEFSKLNKI